MAKVHIKIKTDKRNCRKLINHRLLFLFQWKYMRENLFNVYIYKSPNKSVEVENTLHLLFYIWKRRSKGGCPEGGWKGISIYDCIDFASISFSS